MFKRRKRKDANKITRTQSYDEASRAGSTIGKIITDAWNSQKKPGKAYIFNRRVHHGEIGILLGLSNIFKRSRPDAAGVLSGLGEALSQDDIADKEEWFKFKKKTKENDSEISVRENKKEADKPYTKGDEP